MKLLGANEHSWEVTQRLTTCLAILLSSMACQAGIQEDEHAINGPITTVGNPQDPNSLPQQISDAYLAGYRRIVIRAGTYVFSPTGHPIILLNGWHRARLSGHGVTLVSSETAKANDLIRLEKCVDVELIDLALSQQDQVAYQGRVSMVSQENDRTICQWTPDKGYPQPDPNATRMQQGPNVIDGQTRKLKGGIGDHDDAHIRFIGDGVFQVSFTKKVDVSNGDWLVSRYGDSPKKIHLIESRGCTVDNVILQRNGFAAIREEGGGGNQYYDCHWQLGPKPDRAVEKPLITSSADGFHSTGAYPGPDIENCDFTGVLLDDCIAIHGSLQTVTKSMGNQISVGPGNSMLQVGQPIRISANGFHANGFVTVLNQNPDGSADLTLDKDLSIPVGARVGNPLTNGASFKVLNCHLGNTRAQGISVKADNGLIEGNIIDDCGSAGVSVGPSYGWNEGDYVHDLVIRANHFKNDGIALSKIASVLVHGEGAMGNHNIDIEDNTFEDNDGGDIDLEWTDGATVERNSFTSPSHLPDGFAQPAPVDLHHSSSIRILNNVVKNSQLYVTPWVQASSTVKNLDQQGGRGIRSGE